MNDHAPRPESTPWARRARGLLTVLLLALTGLVAAGLLYSACCQYSWVRMSLNDYGIYTNFIWNSGHGEFFRYLVDKTYLTTHLSFTLLLLGPLFRIWDDPFLLTVVYWLCSLAGFAQLWMIARRHGLPLHLRAALGLCFLAHPLTQRVLLCEFHGVCAYYVLLPWLYTCAAFRPKWTWLPLLLLLGLREEAGVLAIPLLLYFAVTRRWKAGYVYAAVALVYSILAVKFLFPLLSGVQLGHRRARLLNTDLILNSFRGGGLAARAQVALLLFLPALPLLVRRGGWPILVFPSLALLILQSSPVVYQYALQRHYPAAVVTFMLLGLLHAAARHPRLAAPTAPAAGGVGYALYLLALTVVLHIGWGQMALGGATERFYYQLNRFGFQTRLAAGHIPRDGLLLTRNKLTGFTAHRADLLTDQTAAGREDQADYVFLPATHLFDEEGAPWRERLAEGRLGVTYFDHYYVLMQKGASPTGNADVLAARDLLPRTLVLTDGPEMHGETRFVPGLGIARWWHGNGSRAPATLVHGQSLELPPGRYLARFRLAADTPARTVRGYWGQLSLHRLGQPDALALAEVEQVATSPRAFRYQDVRFELRKTTTVEPRVTAGDAALYVDRVQFIAQPEP